MLAVGLEPTTYRLQGECSTIELCQRGMERVITNSLISVQQFLLFFRFFFFQPFYKLFCGLYVLSEGTAHEVDLFGLGEEFCFKWRGFWLIDAAAFKFLP